MIIARYDINDLPHKVAPLWWQEKGLQFTASGYGKRIPTRYMVQIPGSPRWRRVYVCIFSNAGTAYVAQGKDWIVITGEARLDGRYTFTREHTGDATPMWIARFCDKQIGKAATRPEAVKLAETYERNRWS